MVKISSDDPVVFPGGHFISITAGVPKLARFSFIVEKRGKSPVWPGSDTAKCRRETTEIEQCLNNPLSRSQQSPCYFARPRRTIYFYFFFFFRSPRRRSKHRKTVVYVVAVDFVSSLVLENPCDSFFQVRLAVSSKKRFVSVPRCAWKKRNSYCCRSNTELNWKVN